MSLAADVRLERDAFSLDAAISAAPGETVALVGPNGAGKSTLVGILSGLLRADAGSVMLGDRTLDDTELDIHVPPEDRSVGVVFQDLALFPHLSAIENVAFGLRASGTRRSQAIARARSALDPLGMGARAAARPSTLSGGEAQRVALARALVREPELLLLDEPLSALDVGARGRVRDLVRTTLDGFPGVRVLVTHDPVEAMMLADRIIVLEGGRVTQTGTPEEIREAPRTAYGADLVGLNLFSGRLEPAEGAGRLVLDSGSIVVAWPPERPETASGEVLGLLRPSDVSLHTSAPEGSARNVLAGRIASIAIEGGRARVRVDARPPVVAEVTVGSIERLGLSEGRQVWASFKAVEVRLVLP